MKHCADTMLHWCLFLEEWKFPWNLGQMYAPTWNCTDLNCQNEFYKHSSMEGQSGQKEHFLILINDLLILINDLLILRNHLLILINTEH